MQRGQIDCSLETLRTVSYRKVGLTWDFKRVSLGWVKRDTSKNVEVFRRPNTTNDRAHQTRVSTDPGSLLNAHHSPNIVLGCFFFFF